MKKLVIFFLMIFMLLVTACESETTSCRFKMPNNVLKNVTKNTSYIIHMYPDKSTKEQWKYAEAPVNNAPIYNSTGSIPIFNNPSKESPTTEADRKYLTKTLLNLSEKFQERAYGKVLDKHNIYWAQIQSTYEEDVIIICYEDGCLLKAFVNAQAEYKYISIDGDGDSKHKVNNNYTINEEFSK